MIAFEKSSEALEAEYPFARYTFANNVSAAGLVARPYSDEFALASKSEIAASKSVIIAAYISASLRTLSVFSWN